jgi:hypothetical protein
VGLLVHLAQDPSLGHGDHVLRDGFLHRAVQVEQRQVLRDVTFGDAAGAGDLPVVHAAVDELGESIGDLHGVVTLTVDVGHQ